MLKPCRLIFLGFCLTLPAFPVLSQSTETSTETAPLTAQTAAEATSTDTPAAPSLWAAPADLVQGEPATISPARGRQHGHSVLPVRGPARGLSVTLR